MTASSDSLNQQKVKDFGSNSTLRNGWINYCCLEGLLLVRVEES